MTWRPQNTKTRYLIFTKADEEAFSQALREAFPSVLFVREEDTYSLPLRHYGSIAECTEGEINVEIFVPPPRWRPRLFKPLETEVVERPPLWVLYQAGGYVGHRFADDGWEEPTLIEGRVTASFYPEEKEHQAFLRRVWRILEKMTSNRLAVVDHRTLEPKGYEFRDFWAGFDAIRWCLENDKRVLAYNLRPSDEAIAAASKGLTK